MGSHDTESVQWRCKTKEKRVRVMGVKVVNTEGEGDDEALLGGCNQIWAAGTVGTNWQVWKEQPERKLGGGGRGAGQLGTGVEA
ncbi:uncharacterized protein SPSK_03800 [Sporothrix schenckii 1099-18]|uniref:Uncharacterized protein n=1 Tax=Sporothrix schenckii 1099-18 TaxID=1397361 RepID=A0A0F2M0K8_SPOSC|nr:uncharacterized protein SPSK_03800 [Sporothrix schenckii 1099-18]KJR82295.1 hypothetical protein SPSK_03800 [Sporothrix schenckii 1099-18]